MAVKKSLVQIIPCDDPDERFGANGGIGAWDAMELLHDEWHGVPVKPFLREYRPSGTDQEMLEKLQCMVPNALGRWVPEIIRLRMGHLAWHLLHRRQVAADACKRLLRDLRLEMSQVDQRAMQALESSGNPIWGFP